jgi:hypothetical protein
MQSSNKLIAMLNSLPKTDEKIFPTPLRHDKTLLETDKDRG